jgi:periplasmic protein TonB
MELKIKCLKCGESIVLTMFNKVESEEYSGSEVNEEPVVESIDDEAEPTPEPELAEPPKVLRVHRPKPKPKPKPKITKPKPKPRAPRKPKYEPPDDNRNWLGKLVDKWGTEP